MPRQNLLAALIVEDEKEAAAFLVDWLQAQHVTTHLALRSDEALRLYHEHRPALLFLDIQLLGSNTDGIGLLATIREANAAASACFVTGYIDDPQYQRRAEPLNPLWLSKPYDEPEVLQVFEAMQNDLADRAKVLDPAFFRRASELNLSQRSALELWSASDRPVSDGVRHEYMPTPFARGLPAPTVPPLQVPGGIDPYRTTQLLGFLLGLISALAVPIWIVFDIALVSPLVALVGLIIAPIFIAMGAIGRKDAARQQDQTG